MSSILTRVHKINHSRLFSLVVANLLLMAMVAVNADVSHKLNNQLADHPSPYLAMHAEDPVAWQVWGEDVLARARKDKKMLFVSVGYFSCHWCHVMQRESYSDVGVANKLNTHFIPVKVDRELYPALDAYLIDFVQRTRGHAGWPLNVFLTPEGYPVVGITYLPKQQFTELVVKISDLWDKDRAYLNKVAAQAAAVQTKQSPLIDKNKTIGVKPTAQAVNRYLASFSQQAMQQSDEMLGGFGDQTKFPMTSQLQLLMRSYASNHSKPIQEFVILTLEQMATQGLRDHIGGGFFRYTTDPGWQTPHYEKMLYDNANMALLYFSAAKTFKRSDFAAIATETLDFMLRELLTPDGALVASLSAVDQAGIEGGYYLWQKQQLRSLLTKQELQIVSLLWDMQTPAVADAGYLPRQVVSPDSVAKDLKLPLDKVLAQIASAYKKLFKARQGRRVPVDTKQLAAWNGLALAAFVEGAKTKRGQKYQDAAASIRNYIVKKLSDGKNRLWRAQSKSVAIGQAGLEDYAYVISGMLAWAQLVNSPEDYKLASQWADTAWRKFYTATGWQLSDESLLPPGIGVPIVSDNPMPSPSSVLISSSLRLAKVNNNTSLRQRAEASLGLGERLLRVQAFYYASQISAMMEAL
ncbi:MAG: thioredoxin domain-containing protein [Thiohalomonadales bacterium]